MGSGGREHALAWQLAQSPSCAKLYAAPGNPGIELHAECVPIAADDLDGLIAFVKTMGEVGFLRPQHQGLLIIDDQLDGLLEKMAAHVPATTIGQIGSKDL